MSKNNNITRRDFLNGMALTLGASTTSSSLELLAKETNGSYYPPSLTGLRGVHEGAFEVAHSVAWQGTQWPIPNQQTDDTYDLVIVGGGISGLSAALLFQQQVGPKARILVLENHDDFGGHAKRNEFTVDGKKLIAYGGSQSIQDPAKYSSVSAQLLKDIGIHTNKFYDYFDQGFDKKWGLKYGLLFSNKHYDKTLLTDNPLRINDENSDALAAIIKQYPISIESQQSMLDYIESKTAPQFPAWSYHQKIEKLRKLSYFDFLKQYSPLTQEAIEVFNNSSLDIWGVGWDSLSTLEAIRWELPGTEAIGIRYKDIVDDASEDEPYIFHFPDGNAGVARALVRQLIPSAIPGSSMEDLVLSQANYAKLDQKNASVRIRLNSTAVKITHSNNQQTVDVTYVRNQQTYRIKAKHTVLACDNKLIPHICPEVPSDQRKALAYAQRVPLVYANVALRNWKAFAKSGYSGFFVPQSQYFHNVDLDFPVSMGGYEFSQNPDQPIVLHATMIPAKPYEGLSSREQHRIGRQQLYQTSFEEYEQDLVQLLNNALGPYGFDAAKDISAITVNRWPHGYAYEYNELFDPSDWSPKNGPHIAGRAQIGRISIANSDSSAYAYVNGAIDAAARAIQEQLSLV